jgi:zinc protease
MLPGSRVALGAIVGLAAVVVSAQAPQPPSPAGSLSRQALQLPAIQKRRLSNGLPVWAVENYDLAVVQISLLVRSGSGDDPPGQFGIASLTSAMLTEGAGSRSGMELAAAMEALGANLSASSSIDSASLQMHVPVARLAEALPLMAEVAQRPMFPRAALERLRGERLATLQRARDDPDAVAALAISRVIFGPSHPYGTAVIGTAETISAVTPDDLSAYHTSRYQPGNSTLIVVGAVATDEVMRLLQTHFGKWPLQSAANVARPRLAAPPTASRRIVIVDKPNAPQSRVLIGGVGAARSDADFFAIQVMNTVLRGRLTTRLNLNLPGQTSGVRSGFDVRRSPGPFVAGAAVQTDKTAELLTVFLAELAAMSNEIPATELARARSEIAVRFPATFEATGRISSRLQSLESLVVYELPDDYYAGYLAAIDAVSAVDVQRVARRYTQPDHLAVVIVGDRRTIEPSLRSLNIGSIEEATIDQLLASAR